MAQYTFFAAADEDVETGHFTCDRSAILMEALKIALPRLETIRELRIQDDDGLIVMIMGSGMLRATARDFGEPVPPLPVTQHRRLRTAQHSRTGDMILVPEHRKAS